MVERQFTAFVSPCKDQKSTGHYRFLHFRPDLTPNRIFFVLIKNDFYEPSQDNNPYQFGFKEGESNGILDFQITISGTDLDNLNSPNFDQMAYLRLQKYLGMANHGQTNSIDYEQFMNGSTVYVADFSTSLDSNQDYIIPSLKVGYVRLRIRFKEPTTEALHLLCMSEYNSTLSIENGKTGRIVKVRKFTVKITLLSLNFAFLQTNYFM